MKFFNISMLLVSILFFSISSSFANSTTLCHPDLAALVALYNATNGATWGDNTGWIDGAAGTNCTPCSWYGVVCDGSSRVTELDLSSNQLNGSLPIEIGDLAFLTKLDLKENTLPNPLPVEIGNLSNLTFLDLRFNDLTGNLPIEIGNLSSLEHLLLSENMFTGNLPVEIGNLTNLITFKAGVNMFTGSLPIELGNLVNLTTLWLWNNDFSGIIPSQLGNMSSLEELSLSENQLTGSIPNQLGNLANLSMLDLADNQLSGCIPENLSRYCLLSSYSGIRLQNNAGLSSDFNGFCMNATSTCSTVSAGCHPDYDALVAIYNDMGGANWLRQRGWRQGANAIHCDVCEWDGVFCNASGRVERLYLHSNNLSGAISADVANLTMLKELHLSHNLLTGTIPAFIGTLTNLTGLYLHGSQLTGTIPTDLGSLTNLEHLYLAHNQLTGSVPMELGNLSNLAHLYLNDNQLTGCFDSNLSSLCGSLTDFSAVNNIELAGGGDLSAFCSIGSGDCTATACHPDFDALMALYNATAGATWTTNTGWVDGATGTNCDVCNWYAVDCDNTGRVSTLYLRNNNLTGTLPVEIGDLSNLTFLRLDHNNLSGSIPAEMGNLSNLTLLALQANQMDGEIPDELGNLGNLVELYLGENQFSGTIPASLGTLGNLETLYLGDNQLSSSIPAALGNLSNLNSLHLNDNQLSGCFPANLANICPVYVNTSNNAALPNGGDFATFCVNGTGECAMELAIKAFLQGPLNTGTGLMKDDLRVAGLLPNSFGGGTVTSAAVFAETGNDAIVDWVEVQIRPIATPTIITVQRPALLQRDGDIVDVDGKSALNFDALPADTYHVVVKHRNHLGMMSNMSVTVN